MASKQSKEAKDGGGFPPAMNLIAEEILHQADLKEGFAWIGPILVAIGNQTSESDDGVESLEVTRENLGDDLLLQAGWEALALSTENHLPSSFIFTGPSPSKLMHFNWLAGHLAAFGCAIGEDDHVLCKLNASLKLVDLMCTTPDPRCDGGGYHALLVDLQFNNEGSLVGSGVEGALIDRSPLNLPVEHNGESNDVGFRILHALLAAPPSKQSLLSLSFVEPYNYLGAKKIPHHKSAPWWNCLSSSLRALGGSPNEHTFFLQILSAVLKIGNVSFHQNLIGEDRSVTMSDDRQLTDIASLLLIDPELLECMLLLGISSRQEGVSRAALLAKTLYSVAFDWVISTSCTQATEETTYRIVSAYMPELSHRGNGDSLQSNILHELLYTFLAESLPECVETRRASSSSHNIAQVLLSDEEGSILAESKLDSFNPAKLTGALRRLQQKYPGVVQSVGSDSFTIRHSGGAVSYQQKQMRVVSSPESWTDILCTSGNSILQSHKALPEVCLNFGQHINGLRKKFSNILTPLPHERRRQSILIQDQLQETILPVVLDTDTIFSLAGQNQGSDPTDSYEAAHDAANEQQVTAEVAPQVVDIRLSDCAADSTREGARAAASVGVLDGAGSWFSHNREEDLRKEAALSSYLGTSLTLDVLPGVPAEARLTDEEKNRLASSLQAGLSHDSPIHKGFELLGLEHLETSQQTMSNIYNFSNNTPQLSGNKTQQFPPFGSTVAKKPREQLIRPQLRDNVASAVKSRKYPQSPRGASPTKRTDDQKRVGQRPESAKTVGTKWGKEGDAVQEKFVNRAYKWRAERERRLMGQRERAAEKEWESLYDHPPVCKVSVGLVEGRDPKAFMKDLNRESGSGNIPIQSHEKTEMSNCTFQPKISDSSKKLVMDMRPFHDRWEEYGKRKKAQADRNQKILDAEFRKITTPTHAVSKKSKKLADKWYQRQEKLEEEQRKELEVHAQLQEQLSRISIESKEKTEKGNTSKASLKKSATGRSTHLQSSTPRSSDRSTSRASSPKKNENQAMGYRRYGATPKSAEKPQLDQHLTNNDIKALKIAVELGSGPNPDVGVVPMKIAKRTRAGERSAVHVPRTNPRMSVDAERGRSEWLSLINDLKTDIRS